MDEDNSNFEPDSIFLKKKETPQSKALSSEFSILFPEIPKGFFDDMMFKNENKPQSIVEKYENAAVKPYISVVDFNNSEDSPYENKPKLGFEIGLKFSF